jgi:hypothetical protein
MIAPMDTPPTLSSSAPSSEDRLRSACSQTVPKRTRLLNPFRIPEDREQQDKEREAERK